MELATTLRYAADPRRAAEEVAALERAGPDAVRVAEAYGFDPPTVMGFPAARTEHAWIGSAILDVHSRTPALIARTAAGLDTLSGGRALPGVGASGPQAIESRHGKPYDRPPGRTRETIELCRRIWRREVIDHHGITDMPLPAAKGGRLGKPLKILTHPVRPEIPVYVAALRPADVRPTAESADGWLPTLFIPEKPGAVRGTPLAEGTARRDPSRGPSHTVAGGLLAIGEEGRTPPRGTWPARPSRRMSAAWVPRETRARTSTTISPSPTAAKTPRAPFRSPVLRAGKRRPRRRCRTSSASWCRCAGPRGTSASAARRRYPRPKAGGGVPRFREAGVTMLDAHPIGLGPAKPIETVRNRF
ncbi:LLM class flavin-dependent oxidoreductase [Streptomyces sp. CT34]|uniref:LLM class flavin-dependent oxidoreductase n=1 Tax=Streptomyces sp. CT34 TaxID=1553907 RepID=UPI000AA93F1E|nr:LLM class flavin-dependent oxidoreductase [Streptomyces sp. CT34]